MGGWTEDQGDYDDGTEDSGYSQDFDMEPGDDGCLAVTSWLMMTMIKSHH